MQEAFCTDAQSGGFGLYCPAYPLRQEIYADLGTMILLHHQRNVLPMMISLQSYVRQGRHTLKKWALDPRIHIGVRAAGCFLAGFGLSAAGLTHHPLPLAMALVCAMSGWSSALTAGGSLLGYWLFWGSAARQCGVWVLAGLCLSLLLFRQRLSRETPLLIPAAAALIVAVCGVLFQSLYHQSVPIYIYMLQVLMGGGSTWLYSKALAGRNPIVDWITWSTGVLALAQIVPVSWLCLGYPAAGALMTAAPFPAAALGGLALDLAQITPVPMTAVMALGYLVRFFPKYPKWMGAVAPVTVYFLVMLLCGKWDMLPVTGLVLGGILGTALPVGAKATHHRGETGAAQVRLEMSAGVFAQTQQLLLEYQAGQVDEQALVTRAAERACGSCPSRKTCKDARRIGQLPGLILHKPLLNPEELPIVCKKSGRFLAELHRSQEQLRSIQANRERQKEYRAAVIQQYQFLAEYLQDLSDQLARRLPGAVAAYEPQVQVYGNRPEADNGDRCLRFAGIGCKYYVLLCDGMGTGLGAVQEGKTAAQMLKKLLAAGYPAEYALRSLNSLCALRERAGVVTVDLAELLLDSGKVNLYKWGAAPSYLVSTTGAEKIGTVGPPPGLSVTDCREQTERLSLRRGEMLVLVSDGVAQEDTLRCCMECVGLPAAELGLRLLSQSRLTGDDDATAAIIQLLPKGK